MEYHYRTIVTPELEAFGTRHEDDDETEDTHDKDEGDRDHDYISVLP